MLEVRNLRIAFRTGKGLSVPVRDVSFAIGDGERVALVGESGCGKTLTALSIGGLVEHAEISGAIAGSPRVAYIFQNPMQALNPVMKCGRQIKEALVSKANWRERVVSLLKDVALPSGTADKYPCQLSGGQQQRVMIAMALARDPELLIADEPTTALDVTTQCEVLDLIERLANEKGNAVLFITHNLGLVSRYSRRVNVMYAGMIVESGTVEEVLRHPRHPYTKGLIASVPRLDLAKNAPLADIPGVVPSPDAWPVGCAFHPRCSFAADECKSADFKVCPQMSISYK